ncbi:DUF2254 domain-containing protein [Methanofollis ethanolicus]|uniref:DUF2254 domain-containing protein n=1 Tax=Methanofollis ethanolicus TaxID=488124 RepID=UPI0009FA09A1|nr:DUF2254 domain-containing protein [Methanofollis ethanolicus]
MSNAKIRRARIRYTRDRIRVNFWFTPLLMSAGAIILAGILLWVDARIPYDFTAISRLVLKGGVSETRMFLINLGTTILLTAGVVFTLLTLPLSTMASQYGSRLIRLFMGDRTTQFVLGMFVSTVVYCWAVAESLPLEEEGWQIPQLTLTAAVLLLLVSFASLILLAQHLSTMIQAPTIVGKAGTELQDAICSLAQEEPWSGPDGGSPDLMAEAGGHPVRAMKAGYIRFIDHDHLLAVANGKDAVIELRIKTGHFVGRGVVLALVRRAGKVDTGLDREVQHAIHIGDQRSPAQDVVYAVTLLTETALRAMSDNDSYTAMMCLDYLGEGLALYLRQGEPTSRYHDRYGRLRLVTEPVTFGELVSESFDTLRHAGRDSAPVLRHMLDVIAAVGTEVTSPGPCQTLRRQVSLIRDEVRTSSLIDEDRRSICRNADLVEAALPCAG